jgi:hypothetical protein
MLRELPYLPMTSRQAVLPPPAILPLASMARRLGVTQAFLRRLAETGQVPAIDAGGGRWLFSPAVTEAALAELVAAQVQVPTAPRAHAGELPMFPATPTM